MTRYALTTADGKRVRLSRHESRMVARGMEAGFRAGRKDSDSTAECPYPDDGRPRSLWLAGFQNGHQKGAAELGRVRESYAAGLEALDAPAEPRGI